MIVFSQGSCRIGFPLTYLHGQGKIDLIDPHWDAIENKIGNIPAAALGHYHNANDHLRMFQLLQNDSNTEELHKVLNQINGPNPNPKRNRFRLDWEEVWENCKKRFATCDIAVIELCSLKSVKFLKGPMTYEMDDIQNHIKKIDDLTPHCKKLWVCHFRPDVIWDKHSETREILYQAVSSTEHHFDPSPFLAADDSLMLDDMHCSPAGIKFIGDRMLEKMESM